MPFKEVQHTADWSLRVWSTNLPGLFAESALGMNALSGTCLAPDSEISRTFLSSAPDLESLLVSFLSELVYLSEQENLAFDKFTVEITGHRLNIKMAGAPILSIDKAIKAVTYHNLQIQETPKGFEVKIVFDV